MGPGLTASGIGVGGQIAGNQVKNALMKGGTSAITGSASPSWATGAAGMGAGIGISMAGNALANKLKPKEEMPITGGQHSDILDGYGRRLEGAGPGAHGGAIRGATMGANPALAAATGGISIGVGALGGLIAGLATKNATSAYSDYSANDAYDAIGKGYQKYLGRDATPDEIMGRLVGQGYDPKRHEYVGEKGLRYHMDEIASSPEAQAYAARQAGTPATSTPDLPLPSLGATPGTEPLATSPGQSNTSYQTSQGAPGLPKLQPDGTYSAATTPQLVDSQAPSAPSAPPPPNPAWNTDGYSAPQFVPQNYNQQAPPGWDQTKWSDPNHQTPKYAWGRITQDDDPNDIEQMLKAYPGAQFDGKDKITGIPGLGPIDVYQGASTGLNKPQWYDMNAAAAEGGGQAPQGGMPSVGGMPNFANAGGADSGPGYSNSVIQYLMQQMGLDRAATSIGG
jgi:hypothetical protein